MRIRTHHLIEAVTLTALLIVTLPGPLDAARTSGYEGALNVSGRPVAIDPAPGTPMEGQGAIKRARVNPNNGTWSPLGSGMNSKVGALTVYGNKLIAGGWFCTAGGESAKGIAALDGSSWSPLGSGMGGGGYPYYIYSLTVYANQLIASGEFDTAGGVRAMGIAAWDGSSWDSLGSGIGYLASTYLCKSA